MKKMDTKTKVLSLIQDNADTKRPRDSRNQSIIKMFNDGFDVADNVGARKITAQTLFQAHWRLMNKIKPLDFDLHATGRPQYVEQMTTYGLTTVAKRAELLDNFRCKGGVYWNQFLFGDGFYMLGTQDNEEIPLISMVIPNSNLYVDQFATAIRATSGRGATKVLVIFSMPESTAYRLFPEFKRAGTKGTIPREFNQPINTETGRSYNQTYRLGTDLFEVGYFYDIEDPKKPEFHIVGGAAVTVARSFTNEKYPFILKNKPYIPVGQQSCMPTAEGFWNFGVGDLLYRIANVNRQLLNLSIGHAEEVVWPDTLVSIAQGTAENFFGSLQESRRGKAEGLKPYIPIEYDPANPNANRAMAQTLQTGSAMNEFIAIRDILNQEIRRCGITLDDMDVNPQATQYQILAEEEKATAFIDSIQTRNTGDWEFTLSVLLNLGGKFIDKKNKELIDVPAALSVDGVKLESGEFTLGAWADEVKKNNYFVKVDSGSGAIPSNVAKQAKIQRVMGLLQPGTPEFQEALRDFAALNDREINAEPLAPPIPEGMPPQIDPNMLTQMANGLR